jgi:hypothetical protein
MDGANVADLRLLERFGMVQGTANDLTTAGVTSRGRWR